MSVRDVRLSLYTAYTFPVVIIAQMVGAIVASAILDGLTPGPLMVGVSLGAGTRPVQGLFIEMFTTSALVLSILMLAAGTFLSSSLFDCLSCPAPPYFPTLHPFLIPPFHFFLPCPPAASSLPPCS